MAYDALDRMTSKTRPADGSQDVYLAYDSTGWPFGDAIGRLTGVSDAAGYAYFGYDERGEVNFQRRTYSGTNYDVYVSYDAAGRYNGSAYPSNLWAGIVARNAAGQVAEAAAFPTGSGSYDVLAWMGTGPFGPMDYIYYGNNIYGPITRDYDYRISNLTLTNSSSTVLQNTSYTLDGANNATGISDSVHAANAQTLGYDVINRLTSATSGTGGYGSLAWAYDKVGNLTSSTVGSTTTTYALTSGTNRLASITQGSTTTVSTNTVGNITSIPPAVGGSASTFSYNIANRLSGVTGGGSTTASYVYGFDGHRVTKTVGSVTTLYIYGVNGELLEEKNLSTGAATDYIAVEGRPLGIFVPGGSGTLYYVHPDNLGTPQFVTDSSESTVWSTSYQPYGTTGTVTGSITQNIRLPGQYADSETGFSQNWNRDYMPNLGRYLEVDPIGLAGGTNPYAYANGNPLSFVDPAGTDPNAPADPFDPLDPQHIDLTSPFNDFQQRIDDLFGGGDPNAFNPNFVNGPGANQNIFGPNAQTGQNNVFANLVTQMIVGAITVRSGMVVGGSYCVYGGCAGLTASTRDVYVNIGPGLPGASAFAGYATDPEAFMAGWSAQGGRGNVTGGVNPDSRFYGLQVATSSRPGLSYTYGMRLSALWSALSSMP